MYTYLRLACLGSTIALTSLATPAYAMDPSGESEAVSQGPIMIHDHAYPDLSQEQQETLKDLVAQKDAFWKAIQKAEDEEALDKYTSFVNETLDPTLKPMIESLEAKEEQCQTNWQKAFGPESEYEGNFVEHVNKIAKQSKNIWKQIINLRLLKLEASLSSDW